MRNSLIILFFITFSIQGFSFTVIDTLYENQGTIEARKPAAKTSIYCILTIDRKVFGKSCYSSLETCEKRLEFWQDLPDVKALQCDNI